MSRSRAGSCRLALRLFFAESGSALAFFRAESAAAGGNQQALESAQGKSSDSGRTRSSFEYGLSRLAVVIFKVPTELGKAQIDQSGEPALGVGQLVADKTPLPAQKLALLGVFTAWLQRDEITVAYGAGDEEGIIGIGFASPQMRTGALAA